MIAHHFITLTQPWATLMAIGAKRVETRSWKTKFRGPIAIHAAKGYPEECQMLCHREPFASALRAAGANILPRGHIIAVVEIVDCILITAYENRQMQEPERSFGDYSIGRYAIVTEGARQLKRPVAFKGALGIRQIHGEPITEDMLA